MRNAQLRWALGAALLLGAGVGCDDDESSGSADSGAQVVTDSGAEETLDGRVADASGPNEDAGGPVEDGSVDAGEPDAELSAEHAALRAVPETERHLLPGLSAEAYVVRTEANRPHVYAHTRDDLGRVMGFTLARDRLFFMDLQRRLALGRISDLLGEAGLATDMQSRLTGLTEAARRLAEHLDPELRTYLEAAAEGVNAYIQAVRDGELPAPSELALAGPLLGAAQPSDLLQDFTAEDFAAMAAVLMYETNFEVEDVERSAKAAALVGAFEGVEEAELRELGFLQDVWRTFRPLYPEAISTPGFGTNGVLEPFSGPAPSLPAQGAPAAPKNSARPAPKPVERQLLDRAHARMQAFALRLGRDKSQTFGSNAWAVRGAHAAGGETLVAGDGHLSLSVPSLMYQVAMDTSVLGGGDIHQAGLFLSPVPVMGAGTNGDVAWSMVNPVVDITDWYREEILLGEDGLPRASLFKGEEKPLKIVEERYTIADVPALGSVGRDESWARYEIFDGRRIVDIEGRELAADEDGEGLAIVHLGDRRIVPGDIDSDGVITAISFDHGALDATQWIGTLTRMGFSKDVEEFNAASRNFVGGGLFMAAGDQAGNVLFSSYQAVPCRGYLPREEGRYIEGADPNFLLDGTLYGGFELPTDAEGRADELSEDPQRCVIPWVAMPKAKNPDEGFVFTANNDPAGIDTDGDNTNDAYYIGGPWESVRAYSIQQRLIEQAQANSASVQSMADVQADRVSRTGQRFTPFLLGALEAARGAAEANPETLPAHERRLAALWGEHGERLAPIAERLAAWRFDTPSGVETFYHQPAQGEAEEAVATMIFNAWLPRFGRLVWADEPSADLFPHKTWYSRLGAIEAFIKNRGENPDGLASHNPETGESIFFDVVDTPEVERADELMVRALIETLDYLSAPPERAGVGGFGTEDSAAWLWGLRHQVRFESLLGTFLGDDPRFSAFTRQFSIDTRKLPLAPNLGADDPRKGLTWFPRGGDNFSVDASAPGFSGTDFTYNHGPVMRMVMSLKGGRVEGQNIIPGGQSALTNSPFFADQAALWLGNETLPLRFHPDQVAEGATGRELFLPAP